MPSWDHAISRHELCRDVRSAVEMPMYLFTGQAKDFSDRHVKFRSFSNPWKTARLYTLKLCC